VHPFAMAGYVLLAEQRGPGKKRWGKRFQRFSRDALVGNPGDPLIGFPVFFQPPRTGNTEPTTNLRLGLLDWVRILSRVRMSLLAHRSQSL
jgi:hypothetical protein